MSDWDAYYEVVGDEPNRLVKRVVRKYIGNNRQVALDLGAGNLRDSKFLLREGFERVIAVDSYFGRDLPATPGLDLNPSQIESFVTDEGTVDLAIACNVLFFVNEKDTPTVMHNVWNALRSGGVFAFNLLGEKHTLNLAGRTDIAFDTLETVKGLCNGFSILYLGNSVREVHHVDHLGFQITRCSHQILVVLEKPTPPPT